MRSSFVTKSAASLVVLALAAGGLGCAAPGDDAPAPAAASAEGNIGKTQQDMIVFQALSGIQGIWQVTGMIQQTVEYGSPIGAVNAYEETVRLRSDIAALSQSVDTQFNQVLIAIDASDLREIISASEDYWNTMQTLQPGGEAAFFEDVRRQGKLTFGELARLDTILMGSDGLGSSGLVAKTMNTMRLSYSDGSPNDAKANVLGELMLRMRLVQLQAFEVLSRAYSSSGAYVGYMDIGAKRAEFLKRLDNQGNVFFDEMRSYNQWAADSYVRWWAEVSPSEAPYERAAFLDRVYNGEAVLKAWNGVPDGMSLDTPPALGIVSAKYSAWGVGGSIAQLAMHKPSATIAFSKQAFGVSTSAPAQASLTIEYRCEGQPGVRTMTVPEANGKTFTLECSNLDRFVGTYVDSPVTNTFIAEVTKRDATHLLYTGSDKKIWSLAVTADPTKFLVSTCYEADWDPSGVACSADDPSLGEYWTANIIDSETRDPGAIALQWNNKTVKKVPAGWTNPRD